MIHKKFLVASRTDGFGVRLLSIMNAILLSDITGVPFYFTWRNNKIKNIFHDIEDSKDCFHKTFLSKHFIDENQILEYKELSFEDIIVSKNPDRGIFYRVPQGIPKEIRDNTKTFSKIKNFRYINVFNKIIFSEKNKIAINSAFNYDFGQRRIAIHLRAGDIMFGNFRENTYYVKKAIPIPLVLKIIQDYGAENLIIFCQDILLSNILKNIYPNILCSNDLIDKDYDGVQRALFDICLMSRLEKIYAGQSGFSYLASLLTRQKLLKFNSEYDPTFITNIIFEKINDLEFFEIFPKEYISHSILTILSFNNNKLTLKEYYKLIELGIKTDPNNIFYFFLKIMYLIETNTSQAEMLFTEMEVFKKNKLFTYFENNIQNAMLYKYFKSQKFIQKLRINPCNMSYIFLALIFVLKKKKTKFFFNRITNPNELLLGKFKIIFDKLGK